jgi:hypothetical protein
MCCNSLTGKKKPRLPIQLTESDLVLVTPSMITAPGTAALYNSIIWERIIVDEAHQVNVQEGQGCDQVYELAAA